MSNLTYEEVAPFPSNVFKRNWHKISVVKMEVSANGKPMWLFFPNIINDMRLT